jgi:hypothetical protein
MLRAELKRAFLRSLARSAADSGEATLLSVLEAFQEQALSPVKSGHLIVGTSGNGSSVSFRVPPFGSEVTPEEILALSEELLTIYTDSLTTLANGGNTSPADATMITTMLADDRMQTIKAVQQDYTILRWPARY